MSLQAKILKYIQTEHPKIWVIKIEVANQRGCPDILCCVAGLFLAIEVKENEAQQLSEIQKEQLKRIRSAGGEVWIVREFEVFKRLLENLVNEFDK